MKKVLLVGIVSVASLLVGCTDAELGKLNSYGFKKEVTCYSGERLIYKGVSSGKVASESSSDGYYFTPVGSDLSVEVSGNCTILPLGVSNGL